jgi:hypothetical protein
MAAPALAKFPGGLGLTGGVNVSAFTGELGDLIRPDAKMFPNFGLVYQADIAPNLSFRGEATYSVKGGAGRTQGTDNAGNPTYVSEDTWRFEYLEVPLLVRTRFPVRSGAVPYLEVGPAIAVTLGGRFESKGSGLPDQDLRHDMKAVDVGFGGGLGVEIPAGLAHLHVAARYLRGLSDLWNLDDNLTMVNQTWTFALSWVR